MAGQVVVWSPEALEDVNDIAAYIARDSVFYAAAVVEKMLATAIGLNQFPDAGRVVPELNQSNIRERFGLQLSVDLSGGIGADIGDGGGAWQAVVG